MVPARIAGTAQGTGWMSQSTAEQCLIRRVVGSAGLLLKPKNLSKQQAEKPFQAESWQANDPRAGCTGFAARGQLRRDSDGACLRSSLFPVVTQSGIVVPDRRPPTRTPWGFR